MKKEDYFSVRHSEVKKTTSLIRGLAKVWIMFCMLLGLSILAGVGYILTNPEILGEFAGDIVAGYQGAVD